MNYLKNKRGDGLILTMIIVFIVLSLTCVIGQYFYMYTLQQKMETELQRAVNCAVEYAMGDSYRQDKVGHLEIDIAKNEFYKYLRNDLGLDDMHRKYNNRKLAYTIRLDEVSGQSEPPEFRIRGVTRAKTMFSFLMGDIEIPFKISSTNFRMD